MSIQALTQSLKSAVDARVKRETRAMRGEVKAGMFYSGTKAYPYKQAVDCKLGGGHKVWAQLSTNGNAVIVGD